MFAFLAVGCISMGLSGSRFLVISFPFSLVADSGRSHEESGQDAPSRFDDAGSLCIAPDTYRSDDNYPPARMPTSANDSHRHTLRLRLFVLLGLAHLSATLPDK
jgi:hypothetical protein